MSAEKDSIPDQKQRVAACMSMWRGEKGGKKPKSSQAGERLLSVFTVAQDIEIRREDLDGKEHVVLPLIGLVEGVYTCANCNGANFYPAREFGKNPGAWNGRPITIGHPMRSGNFVSAGSPDVWATERIGTAFNARLDGTKLRVEAWVDPEAVKRAGDDAAAVLEAAEAGDQVEVSTAAWIDEAPRVGAHAGKQYEAVQTNFQPDHIALLKVGDIGACSWEDGCGVRVAQASLDDSVVVPTSISTPPAHDGWQPNVSSGSSTVTVRQRPDGALEFGQPPCCEACGRGESCDCAEHDDPEANQTAKSLEYALEVALEDKYRYAMIVDWDEEFVYFGADGERGLCRLTYTEDSEGNVTLGEDHERVRPIRNFVVVNQEDGEMADDKSKAAANEKPSDDKQSKTHDQQVEHKAPDKPQLSSEQRQIAELQAKVEHLTAQAAAKPKAQTLDEYLEQAPAEIRESLFAMHKQQAKRKLELIDKIKVAPGCMHSEDELNALSVGDLEKLVSLATRADYSVTPPERSALKPLDGADYVETPASPWDKPAVAAS